jgi:Chitin binding Peritrophin-A domain
MVEIEIRTLLGQSSVSIPSSYPSNPTPLYPLTSNGAASSTDITYALPSHQLSALPSMTTVDVRQLGVNPCILPDDSQGVPNDQQDAAGSWRSPPTSYYRPHPDTVSKYVECFPDQRLIVIRRCGPHAVWSQRRQVCIVVHDQLPATVFYDSASLSSSNTFESTVFSSDDSDGHSQQKLTIANPCGASISDGRRHWTSWIRPVLYYPYPGDDTRFIQCAGGAGGRAFVRRCPAGLRWNRRALTCDRTADGDYSIIWRSSEN